MCFCVFVFFGCANIVPPNGGEKDTSPPVVALARPNNNSTFFEGNSIFLEFNEYVQLQNAGMIRISPSCPEGLKITQKGKQLKIEILCQLDKNTTYTINFGRSIVDLNEGNSLQNFKYVFSTGKHIDSLSVGGLINQLYFKDGTSSVLVGLYQNIDSLSPYFYTFANPDNSFLIDNIKAGTYILYAIDDEDYDFKHSDGELISFPKTINNFDTIVNLGLFYDTPKFTINNVEHSSKQSISFEHSPMKDSITVLNAVGIWDRDHQSSVFWFHSSPRFIKYQLYDIVDSIETHNTDSMGIKMQLLSNISDIKLDQSITIKSNKPIDKLSSTGFRWKASKNVVTPTLKDLFTINIPIDFYINNTHETLIIDSGAIYDVFGCKNDSISFDLDFNTKHYGQLNVRGVNLNKNTVVELFQDEIIFRKAILEDSLFFDFIIPGKYNLRTFEDLNQDGLWTTGNIKDFSPPEPVKIYPQPIDIKSNWEIDVIIEP